VPAGINEVQEMRRLGRLGAMEGFLGEVAPVGRGGVGKSTVAALLTRYLPLEAVRCGRGTPTSTSTLPPQ
jgi:hypothetical protein